MLVAADTHSHIYEMYDVQKYISSAFKHLKNGVLFLTQSNKSSPAYETIVSRLINLPGLTIERMEGFAKVSEVASGNQIYIVPGVQIISEEKIEVLALAYEAEDLSGEKAEAIIAKLNSMNGPVVLPWSPGKWLGKRGGTISRLIIEYPRLNFMIGDIAIRALGEPELFKKARAKSIRILCGSDSLPLAGEERMGGIYYSTFEVPSDFTPGVNQFREMLLKLPNNASGLRNSLPAALFRWLKQLLAR